MTQNIPEYKTTSGLKRINHWTESALRHWIEFCRVVDWSNRSVPSITNLDGEDAYDEEQGFFIFFYWFRASVCKDSHTETYLNNLDAEQSGWRIFKFDFDTNGYHRVLFETLAEATDKWYENTTDQFFLIGPEAAADGPIMVLDYMAPDDSYWLRLRNFGQSYENVARSIGTNRITHARANNSDHGVKSRIYLDEDQFHGEVIRGGMSSAKTGGIRTSLSI